MMHLAYDFGIVLVVVALAGALVVVLRRRAARLEALVCERTAELERRTREAEEARAAADQLLRTVSHDLRTPLNNVFGALELAELQIHRPAEAARWVAVGRAASVRLRLMLDDLIAQARARVSYDPFVPVRVPVASAIDAAVGDVRQLAIAQGREVAVAVAPEVSAVAAESDALRQSVADLLVNALTHAPPGPVTVTVRQAGERVAFEVSDAGLSFTGAEREALARPYRPADERPGAGPDLAVTVAAGLVRRCGGELRFRVDAAGCHAAFELPAWHDAAPRRVLVVDDDHVSAANAGVLVEQLGFVARVVGGARGRAAEDAVAVALSEFAPDVVVSDHELGDGVTGDAVLTGLAAAAVRGAANAHGDAHGDRRPAWARRVVAMTSDSARIAPGSIYAVVLAKPLDAGRLGAAINSLVTTD